MESTVHATYLIPASRFEAMEKAVKKLARKVEAGKTAAEFPPAIEATREVIRVWLHGRDMGTYNPERSYDDKAEMIPYLWVTLKYARPVLNGWHLVAVYDWEVTPEGQRTCYVSPVPGQFVPPEYKEAEAEYCDHCHTKRQRKKLMLLTKNFHEYVVVGSTCVKDFLGHATPKSFVDCFDFEQTIERFSDGSYAGGPSIAYLKVREILTLSAMFIRLYGYVRAGEYDRTPTGHEVANWYGPSNVTKPFPTEDDEFTAIQAERWIAKQEAGNDYIDTLQKAVEAGAISPKRVGIVASAVFSYQRYMERKIEDNRPVANEHLGTVGERLRGLTADVARVRYSEGYYGTTSIVTLYTPAGHTLVWFASGYKEIEKGETWTFDGTVKKHDEYNGMAQTVLSRVKYAVAA